MEDGVDAPNETDTVWAPSDTDTVSVGEASAKSSRVLPSLASSCSESVSLLVPFVLAYIVYAWRAIDSKKLDKEELTNDHAY